MVTSMIKLIKIFQCLITNDPPEHQNSRKEIAAVNNSRLGNSVKNFLWGTEKKKKRYIQKNKKTVYLEL